MFFLFSLPPGAPYWTSLRQLWFAGKVDQTGPAAITVGTTLYNLRRGIVAVTLRVRKMKLWPISDRATMTTDETPPLREHVVNDVAVNVGKTAFKSVVIVAQPLVIQTEQMKHGGVEIING